MMLWYGAHFPFWQVSLMWIGMILFWGVLIWVIYALISPAIRRPPRSDQAAGSGSARQILDQRLARGDIDEAEYGRLRDLLSAGDHDDQHSTPSAR